jgi:hypothetical protein
MIKLHRITLLAIVLGVVVLALPGKGTWAAPERDVRAQTVPSPTPDVTDTPVPTASPTSEPPTATSEPGPATNTPTGPTATTVGTAVSPAQLTQTAQAQSATPARLPTSGAASGPWLTAGALLLLAGGLLLGASLVSRRLG